MRQVTKTKHSPLTLWSRQVYQARGSCCPGATRGTQWHKSYKVVSRKADVVLSSIGANGGYSKYVSAVHFQENKEKCVQGQQQTCLVYGPTDLAMRWTSLHLFSAIFHLSYTQKHFCRPSQAKQVIGNPPKILLTHFPDKRKQVQILPDLDLFPNL